MYQVCSQKAVAVMCIMVPLSAAEINAQKNDPTSIKVEFRETNDAFMPNEYEDLRSADFTIKPVNGINFDKGNGLREVLKKALQHNCGFKYTDILGVSNQYI
jgi:hypothetical protein